jgi:hypothetical protein
MGPCLQCLEQYVDVWDGNGQWDLWVHWHRKM